MSEDFLSRLAAVIAAAAIQREIDQKPCQKCGGDPLRPPSTAAQNATRHGRRRREAEWPFAEARRSRERLAKR